jgi:hypothetical protein
VVRPDTRGQRIVSHQPRGPVPLLATTTTGHVQTRDADIDSVCIGGQRIRMSRRKHVIACSSANMLDLYIARRLLSGDGPRDRQHPRGHEWLKPRGS